MKPKLFLLHGALGSSEQFNVLRRVISKDFETLVLDFEGHGKRMAEDRPFRIEYFAENLEIYLEEQQTRNANIFGYSMGGYVAMYLAARKPGLIGKIFTLASKLDWNPETSRKEAAMLDAEAMTEKVPAFAEELRRRHIALGWKDHLKRTADMMLDLGENPRLAEGDFEKIKAQVRLGLGDRDKMVGLGETHRAYRLIPKSEFQVFPKMSHPIERADVNVLASSIKEFFSPEV